MSDVTLRSGLPPLPRRMRKLALDERGYPVPWFVAWPDGQPDFRVSDSRKLAAAVKQRLCWACGEPLGRYLAFVIGPMCAVNRISSEPPSHRDCAEFSAIACPFLSRPKAQRREANLPEGRLSAAGLPILRNPGVTLVWITYGYRVVRDQTGTGVLFEIGDAVETLWFAEGRVATRAEILHSIETGLPILREMAERDGPEGIAALERQTKAAMGLVPA